MLFLTNTCFELELENSSLSLNSLLHTHPNFLQLQFLFTLLASQEDRIVVTDYPSDDYIKMLEDQGFAIPQFALLEEGPFLEEGTPWGVTENIRKFFLKNTFPSQEAVLKLSSKLFAHQLSPLPGSKVLSTLEELNAFPDGLIKLPHGFSGRGNIPTNQKQKLQKISFPVLGEPLKQRVFDFSTHWEIKNKELLFLGATSLENTKLGTYIGNRAGNDLPFSDFIEEQKAFARSKKESLIKTGYFGPLSMDAMIYEENGYQLQPIIEINPRKTMGWFTFALWKKWGGKALEIRYEKNHGQVGLLPREKIFSKQLTYTVYR